jgi:hypothetical protein
MALSPVRQVVRLFNPFVIECNNKKGKGATVAKITNRCLSPPCPAEDRNIYSHTFVEVG